MRQSTKNYGLVAGKLLATIVALIVAAVAAYGVTYLSNIFLDFVIGKAFNRASPAARLSSNSGISRVSHGCRFGDRIFCNPRDIGADPFTRASKAY